MNTITKESLADVELTLSYQSALGFHQDRFLAKGVNLWRDFLPQELYSGLVGRRSGDSETLSLAPGRLVPVKRAENEFSTRLVHFNAPGRNGDRRVPRYGRFYPRGLLTGIAGVYPQNQLPFRCTGVNGETLGVSFNHPLAEKYLTLSAKVHQVHEKTVERGGTSVAWAEVITDGPGMQTRYNGEPTDFMTPDALSREDSSEDGVFYRQPRFVKHMDEMALSLITRLYGRLLRPDSDVLDLMGSWVSHLPDRLPLRSVTGLGLNHVELAGNARLNRFEVHDLNQDPRLPFPDDAFDAVICSASVEYLTNPTDVFYDVARILRPDGLFILTFTNRWFPPKVTRIWMLLHEFERLGLVLEYLARTKQFHQFNTLSVRGYPRPITDKYYPTLLKSDPVYAVWATKG